MNNSNSGHNSKNSFDKFRQILEDRKNENESNQNIDNDTRQKKHKLLIPVRQLLKKIQDLNIMVDNATKYSHGSTKTNLEPVLFVVKERETTTPTLAPGKAIHFEHPADIEIAIPNEQDYPLLGVIKINCSTDHPDRLMLTQKFNSIDEACDVLAEFLAKNVASLK